MRFDTWAIVAGVTATLAPPSSSSPMALLASRRRPLGRSHTEVELSTRLLGRPVLSLGASFAADPAGAGRSRLGSLTPVAAIAMGVAAVLAVATLDSSRTHLTSSPRLYGAAAELIYESNGTFGISDVVERPRHSRCRGAHPSVVDQRRHDVGDRVDHRRGRADAFETILGGALPPMSAGRYPAGPDEVVLGTATADDLGVGVGEPVTITALDGSGELTLQVTGTVVSWGTRTSPTRSSSPPRRCRPWSVPGVAMERCNLSADVVADVIDDAAGDVARTDLAQQRLLRGEAAGERGPVGRGRRRPVVPCGVHLRPAAARLLHQLTTTSRRRRHDLAVARALGLPARTRGVADVAGGAHGHRRNGGRRRGMGWSSDRWCAGSAGQLGVLTVTRFPIVFIPIAAFVGAAVAVLVSLGPRLRAAPPATGRDVEGGMKLKRVDRCERRSQRREDRSAREGGSVVGGMICVAGERNDRCGVVGVVRHQATALVPACPRRACGLARRVLARPHRRCPAGRASIDRFVESTGLADVVVFTGGEPGTDVLEPSPRIGASLRSTARTPW